MKNNVSIHPRYRNIALASSIALLLASCGGDDGDPSSAMDVVRTAGGEVKAVDRLGMRSYFAIPFAAPPTGERRWTAPAAPQAWTTTLANTKSAAPCLQTSASPFRLAGDSEDCLYLDVHAPTGQGPFPVMVNLHGGAFNTGGTSVYADPSPLVTKGVIVVNVAYRLGAMGFLAHPSLASDGAAGNYGIMDQQAALKWVQDNIVQFAGDKNNVTLFGESAGGFSVMTHLASPGSKGLFNKAMIQSGNYGNDRQLSGTQMGAVSTAIADTAINAAKAAGVTGIACNAGAVTAACLRSLPDPVIRTYLANAISTALPIMVPSVDGKVLTEIGEGDLRRRREHQGPDRQRHQRERIRAVYRDQRGRTRAAATPPNVDPANTSFSLPAAGYAPTIAGLTAGTGIDVNAVITNFYPLSNYGSNPAVQPSLAAASLATDLGFSCPALRTSQRIATQGSPIYMYEFRDQTALPSVGVANGNYYLSFPQGAAHSYDLQYLYNLGDLGNAERRELQTAMTRYWSNFAKSGNPNTGGDGAGELAGVYGGGAHRAGAGRGLGWGCEGIDDFDADHKCTTCVE